MSDVSPVKIDVKVDLTEPTNKVIDTVVAPFQSIHKGIVKIFSACTGKWFSDRERQIKLIAAQTAKDVEDINAGRKEYRNGNLITVELAQTSESYYHYISKKNGTCDAKRLEAAMLEAAIELSAIPENEISDEPLNQTFFNHWRAEAELIDEEELRKWWAHLLVEETKKSNSISPRTLDVAKNLSQKEAIVFEKITRYCFDSAVIIDSKGYPMGGNYSDILSLQDAGLIGQASTQLYKGLLFSGNPHKFTIIPTPGGKYFFIASINQISFRCNYLTVAGKELLETRHYQIDLEDIKLVAKEISRQNRGVLIKLIDANPETRFEINKTPIWTSAE